MRHLTFWLVAIGLLCSYSNTNAQLLKKLTSKIGGKNDASFAHLNEVNDELKVSGQYTSLEPISIETASGFSKKVSTFGLEFNKEKDGDIVNELTFYMTKSKTFEMKLKESWKSKFNQVVFYHWSTSSYYTEFIQLEPGVIASTTLVKSSSRRRGPAPADLERKVENVLVTDPAKLEVYDKETAKVKVDMIMGALNIEAVEKKKKEMMTYTAYKDNVGKIVFSDSYKKFNYLYTDKPSEDPKNFKKEAVMGKNLYFRAYLDKPVSVTHPGAWLNISYEINGKKSDREELRSKSGAFSKKIKRFDSDNSKFCPSVRSLISVERSATIWDYAYINTLHQIKDELKENQVYTMTVTLSAYKDGENIATLATGKINLKYTEDSKEIMFENKDNYTAIINKYEKFLND